MVAFRRCRRLTNVCANVWEIMQTLMNFFTWSRAFDSSSVCTTLLLTSPVLLSAQPSSVRCPDTAADMSLPLHLSASLAYPSAHGVPNMVKRMMFRTSGGCVPQRIVSLSSKSSIQSLTSLSRPVQLCVDMQRDGKRNGSHGMRELLRYKACNALHVLGDDPTPNQYDTRSAESIAAPLRRTCFFSAMNSSRPSFRLFPAAPSWNFTAFVLWYCCGCTQRLVPSVREAVVDDTLALSCTSLTTPDAFGSLETSSTSSPSPLPSRHFTVTVAPAVICSS